MPSSFAHLIASSYSSRLSVSATPSHFRFLPSPKGSSIDADRSTRKRKHVGLRRLISEKYAMRSHIKRFRIRAITRAERKPFRRAIGYRLRRYRKSLSSNDATNKTSDDRRPKRCPTSGLLDIKPRAEQARREDDMSPISIASSLASSSASRQERRGISKHRNDA